MKQIMTSRPWLAGMCAILFSSSAAAQPSFYDAMVQAPQLSAPKPGSIAGEYAQVAFGPADVSRGGFALPGPFEAPEDRGPLLASPFPTYSPGAGISEWGMGWKVDSWSVSRWRPRGELDFATDELTSPWGRLVLGTDAAWYPADLGARVRVEIAGNVLTAYLPDGSTWRYGGSATYVVDTPRGVYSWLLREATSATGETTSFAYARSPSGRPYVRQVEYGGRGAAHHDLIELEYETLSLPFVDMRSGEEQKLDWRVSAVRVSTRLLNPLIQPIMVERWRYTLSYEEAGLGPAFYLSDVQQIFASGEAAPVVQYRYHTASESLAAAAFQPVPKLSGILSMWGNAAIMPWCAALLDEDEDGRLDFEHSRNYALAIQEEEGFRVEELPPRGAGVESRCRPHDGAANEPRPLARMWPESAASHVVHVEPSAGGTRSDIRVCGRDGMLLAQQRLTGNWELGPNTRLVDINRDEKPELLHLYSGGYEVLLNESSQEGALAFGAPRVKRISPEFSPHTTWVHDVNGDTVADLVSRYETGFVVWLGNGQSGFQTTGQVYSVRDVNGRHITNLLSYAVTFVDVNRDGLADVLLSHSDVAALLVNSGKDFRETRVPGLRFYDGRTSVAVVGDLAGTGDTSFTVTRHGEAYAISLERSETGLMKSADDGKGTVLRFAYKRSPAGPGARQRYPVLDTLRVESSGYKPVDYVYDYAGPVHHGAGKFLVGFEHVIRRAGTATEEISFLNDDTNAGLLLFSAKDDAASPLLRSYTYREYEDATFQGIGFKRLTLEENGWQDASDVLGAPVREVTEHVEYTGELCPTRTRRTAAYGTLETQVTLAAPSDLTRHLHCMQGQVVLTGTHEEPELDFRHAVRVTRSPVGLVERVETMDAAGELLVHQRMAYNSDYTVRSVSAPGRGTTVFGYDSPARLLRSLTAPDQTVVEVTERSVARDQVLALTTTRGRKSYTEFFRYDGQERLVKEWNDLGAASEGDPRLQLEYAYATALRPASIAATALIEAGVRSRLQTLDYFTAAGERMAEASRIPEGWAIGDVITRDPGLGLVERYSGASVDVTTNMADVDYELLLQGAEWTSRTRVDVWGTEIDSTERLHLDVEREVGTSLCIVPGGVLSSVKDRRSHAGSLEPARLWRDAGGRVYAREDEAGNIYDYSYDALGRLRSVTMPDGASHRVSYDGHGRVSRVAREGIATVEYEYEPETGLLSSKRFVSPQEQEVRSESWIYDDIGRATHEIHADAITGETQTYRFYYDGATPEQPKARNAPGLLTAVTGEGYSKRFEHRADGKVVRSTLVLDGWRAVESEVARYAENGEVAEETTTVKDSGGQVLSTVRKRYGWDAYGRLSTLEINGEPLASFLYTARGLLAGVDFGGAGSVTFGYDEVTEARASVEQTTPAWTSSVSWRLNSRGFTDAEQLEVGATRLTRQYSYSPEGFLTGSQDAEHSYAYGFDANGLPVSITESGSTRALVMEGDSLDAGGVLYGFDELGRTEVKGDLVQSYGPNGQVATASRGGSSWGYLYDEHGQRLVKRTGAGVPVAAYLDDGSYLDGTGLTEPVHVGGQLVGLLKNGVFRMLAVDRRGTVLAEADGTARLASPFGSRSVHPADAAAVDYVEKGYDADLGVVRMGVRDYDPAIHRFTTPDPLFLEQPDRCVASPVECNLYGYARNRPLDYVDPEGTCISCWLANAVNRFGPSVEQAVRRAGPAIVQSARQAGPRLNQAVRQAGPWLKQTARDFVPRLQATVRQGVEFVKRDAKAAQQHVKNAVERTKNVVSNLTDKASTVAQGSADASVGAERGAGEAGKVLIRTPRNLQKFFDKHGTDFGLTGNWNPSRAADASRAIHQHINSPGVRHISGRYLGREVIHHLDPSTGLNVIEDMSGNFVSGWRLSAEQLERVATTGRLY